MYSVEYVRTFFLIAAPRLVGLTFFIVANCYEINT